MEGEHEFGDKQHIVAQILGVQSGDEDRCGNLRVLIFRG